MILGILLWSILDIHIFVLGRPSLLNYIKELFFYNMRQRYGENKLANLLFSCIEKFAPASGYST